MQRNAAMAMARDDRSEAESEVDNEAVSDLRAEKKVRDDVKASQARYLELSKSLEALQERMREELAVIEAGANIDTGGDVRQRMVSALIPFQDFFNHIIIIILILIIFYTAAA